MSRLKLLRILISGLLLLCVFVVFLLFSGVLNPYGDIKRAANIEEIRKNKDSWRQYRNSELGFSLLLPPGFDNPRSAPLKSHTNMGDGIEFDTDRVQLIDNFGPESISIYVINDPPVDEQQMAMKYEKFHNTNLVKINESEFLYLGNKNLLFTITGGQHVAWMYHDNFLPYRLPPSQEAEQIKKLQLEILQTIEFFPPGTN